MAIELLKAELPESSYGEFVSETEQTKGVIELPLPLQHARV